MELKELTIQDRASIWDLNRMKKEPEEVQVEPGECCTSPYECWYYTYCHDGMIGRGES